VDGLRAPVPMTAGRAWYESQRLPSAPAGNQAVFRIYDPEESQETEPPPPEHYLELEEQRRQHILQLP
ncbi:MAG TPA: hypothetical protein VGG33_22880, partial [Polyangia bacterium]